MRLFLFYYRRRVVESEGNECLCSREFVYGGSKRELLTVRIRVPLSFKKRLIWFFFFVLCSTSLVVVVMVNVVLVAEAIFPSCLPSYSVVIASPIFLSLHTNFFNIKIIELFIQNWE